MNSSATLCSELGCILPWIAGLIFFAAGCDQSAPTASNGGDVRARVREELGIVLPEEAQDVKCHVASAMVKWVYVRFDLPRPQVGRLFSEDKLLSRLPSLGTAPEVWERMAVCAGELAWWRAPHGATVPCASTEWRKEGATSDWICQLDAGVVATGESGVTVFLQYSEEPTPRRER